jgi:hypothetical protein
LILWFPVSQLAGSEWCTTSFSLSTSG